MTEPLTREDIIVASGRYPHIDNKKLLQMYQDKEQERQNNVRNSIIGGVLCLIFFVIGISSPHPNSNEPPNWYGVACLVGSIIALMYAYVTFMFADPENMYSIQNELRRRSVDYPSKVDS